MPSFPRTPVLALGLGLLSGGCAGPPPPTWPLAHTGPGTTIVHLANHVAAGELDRVIVAVDGQPLALSPVPPPGRAPTTMASLALSPGAHTLAVRVKARLPATSGEVIVVGAHQPFLIERGPADITIDVRAAPAAPLSVTFAISGGRLAPDAGAAPAALTVPSEAASEGAARAGDDGEPRCAFLLPIPRALCRAAADLDEAARRNDVVATLCVRDKLAEMRRLSLIGEASASASASMAEAAVGRLSRLVDRCWGGAVASPTPDGLTVIPPVAR